MDREDEGGASAERDRERVNQISLSLLCSVARVKLRAVGRPDERIDARRVVELRREQEVSSLAVRTAAAAMYLPAAG